MSRSARIPAIAAKLQPALVVSLRTNGQGVNANARLRETSAAPSPVPVLAVWDAKLREALAAIPAGAIDAKFTAHIAAPAVTSVKLRNVIGVLRGSDAAPFTGSVHVWAPIVVPPGHPRLGKRRPHLQRRERRRQRNVVTNRNRQRSVGPALTAPA